MTGVCFIATATYGSPSADEVQFLRLYRDNIVKTTKIGRVALGLFERFYYSFSPSLAQVIRDRKWVRLLARIFVTDPIVNVLLLLSLFSSGARGHLDNLESINVETGIVVRGLGGIMYCVSWLMWNIFLVLAILESVYFPTAVGMWLPMVAGLALARLGSWIHRTVDFEICFSHLNQ